jgi:hypothetical protein
LTAVALLAPLPASAQFDACNVGAPAACTTIGSTKTCSKMAILVGGMTTPVVAVSNNVISCSTQQNATSITFVARAMTTAPPTRTCYWTGITNQSYDRCTIDMTDGLPVELMDFEIAEDSEADGNVAPEHGND